MKLPNQFVTAPFDLKKVGYVLDMTYHVTPQDCSTGKKILCGAAIAACAASCSGGPEACAPCFAALGLSSCVDCV